MAGEAWVWTGRSHAGIANPGAEPAALTNSITLSQSSGPNISWLNGAALYQIYPLSFRDRGGDGWGDLDGVIEGLDHVASLGVDGVWISPFYPSPRTDFGYDVADHRAVDPRMGNLAVFDRLVYLDLMAANRDHKAIGFAVGDIEGSLHG